MRFGLFFSEDFFNNQIFDCEEDWSRSVDVVVEFFDKSFCSSCNADDIEKRNAPQKCDENNACDNNNKKGIGG